MTVNHPPDHTASQASLLPADVLHHCFGLLQPRDLCRASAVCRLWRDLNRDSAANRTWRAFYSQLWLLPPHLAVEDPWQPNWQAAFGQKMQQAGCWTGKAAHDNLYGHTAAVRCVALHASSNTLVTGSLDRTLRCWDLENGIQRAVSRPHGGTVRSLAVDEHLIASGSSDHQIRVWRRGSGSEGLNTGSAGSSTDAAGRQAGDTANSKGSLGRRAVVSGGHSGPVTSLELTPDALISGSWDCTVRVWDRSRLECLAALQLDDWVTSLAVAGPNLAIGCGKEALLYSAGSGAWRQVQQATQHNGAPVTAVRGTLDGRYLFFGTGEGVVVGCDLRCDPSSQQAQRVLLQGSSGVTGMSWEHPCLGASFQRGQVVLLNAEAAMGQQRAPLGSSGQQRRGGSGSGSCEAVQEGRSGGSSGGSPSSRSRAPWVRWLSAGGGREAASCVAVGNQRLAVGLDSGMVVQWDFSRALEAERAATALRQRKQQRRLAAAVQGKAVGRNAGLHGC